MHSDKIIFTVTSISELDKVAEEIFKLSDQYCIFCFYGNLGAGKTALITNICKKLQVIDSISSPTYPIINEYQYTNGTIYHIDLYRLSSIDEASNIGLEDYLYSGSLCFIEWPDKFESMLPERHIKVNIRKLENETRAIEISNNAE